MLFSLPSSNIQSTGARNHCKSNVGIFRELYNIKYMIASTQISAFIAVLVFKLLSRKVVFINRKDNRSC